MTFRFIEDHRDQWPVRLLCETLEVSTAGYYAWRGRPASAQEQRRDALVVQIRAIHAEVKARYGSPCASTPSWRPGGQDCCVNTVAELMRSPWHRGQNRRGSSASRGRRIPSTACPWPRMSSTGNLTSGASANEVWVTDITYIPTRQGPGCTWPSAVEDLYSRRVVGLVDGRRAPWKAGWWSMPWRWRCSRRLPGRWDCWQHSDRGSQYASEHYQLLLADHGISSSMSRRADGWDNAPMESFFASLKKELVHDADFSTRAEGASGHLPKVHRGHFTIANAVTRRFGEYVSPRGV